MKRALLVISAVAGYCLVEVVALIDTLTLRTELYPLPTKLVVLYWAQILLIPGIGILLSRFIYGAYRWKARAIATVLVGVLGIPATLIFLALVLALLVWIYRWISVSLSWALVPLVLGGAVFGLFLVIRRIRRWSIRFNAESWLARHQSSVPSSERKLRHRAILVSSWIPVATVLIVFLFFFVIWGVFWRVANPTLGELPGYHVPVPIAWIASATSDTDSGRAWLSGYAMGGIGSNFWRYFHADAPVSRWSIGTDPYARASQYIPLYRPPEPNEIVGRRDIKIGDESLACVEYWPAYSRYERWQDSKQVFVDCRGAGRLSASFGGQKTQVPAFYKMLEETTLAK